MLQVDQDRVKAVQREINDMPQVTSVMRKDLFVKELRRQTGDSIGAFTMVLTLFAVAIALSVVYNNARVALSMRSRELASLRVLGFTRREISSILISELAVQVLLGIPLGLMFGRVLAAATVAANDPEQYRFPSGVTNHTLAFAALVTACAAIASALLVRRKLDKLDLIEVLKTRE
jgi:putative ABC transport system permease protein